jgi:hypothetical protein
MKKTNCKWNIGLVNLIFFKSSSAYTKKNHKCGSLHKLMWVKTKEVMLGQTNTHKGQGRHVHSFYKVVFIFYATCLAVLR